jgi:DTW domain-containing protein YfiP
MRSHRALGDDRRCPACRLHRSLCLCDLVPAIQTRTRVVLIQHQLELRKPTNTGRLAARCLPGSRVLVRGAAPIHAVFTEDDRPVLLFPHRDAQPLERWRGQMVTLIVPDATWRQAVRVRRRVPGLDRVPCAVLPPAAPSAYRLRRSLRPDRLSTLEAIARAMGLLEDPAIERRLESIFRVMVDRMLWSNGRLPADEVTGGIPAGALAHDPLSGQAARRMAPAG